MVNASTALMCLHGDLCLEEVVHDEINESILQLKIFLSYLSVNTTSFWWSVDVTQQHGSGSGFTECQLSSTNTSTSSNSLSTEPHPPATTNTSGDVVPTDAVLYRLVLMEGSDGRHSRPVALENTWLVHFLVDGSRPPTATNWDL